MSTKTRERAVCLREHEVRALQAEGVVEVRRRVKPQPTGHDLEVCEAAYHWELATDGTWCGLIAGDHGYDSTTLRCPLGAPGDRLWGREAYWSRPKDDRACFSDGSVMARGWGYIPYRSSQPYEDGELVQFGWRKRSPATMPRWASRWDLRNAGVRAERAGDGAWEWVAVLRTAGEGET